MSIFFAASALVVSLISLVITITLWRASNRPVVTACIRTHKGGNVAIFYNLEVVNTGTRPAKNVRMSVKQDDLECAAVPASERRPDFDTELRLIERCFEERATISVLLNGESRTNAFGHTSVEDPFWLPGATLPVTISYRGLEGQSYRTSLLLRIDDTASFAGCFYDT